MNALLEWDAHERNKIIGQTFGHLAPKKNCCYPATIVFAFTEHGEWIVIQDNLPGSPWMCGALNDFISDLVDKVGIYKFVGTFKNYKFTGKLESIKI